MTPLDLDPIRQRHHLGLDPDACGTCRQNVANGQHAEHQGCVRRAMLIPALDAPDYEDLVDVPEDERAQLPARFHIPVYDDLGTPKAWTCAVCWGDGWVSQWPCATATAKGGEVFAAQHHGERARWDGARLVEEVLRFRAENAELVAQRERRRSRLIALQNDALDMRGSLSPNGEDPKVPFPLGETLTPAVDWLISRVAELEQQIAELTMTPRERANAHCRALLAAGDYEGATAYAEAFEASEAHALANPRP